MRKTIGVAAAVAVVAGLLLATPAGVAQAVSAGVHFSADHLPTWQTNGVVYALGQSRGRVVVGGTFTALRPPTGATGAVRNTSGLAILNAETGVPETCQLSATGIGGGQPSVRAVTTSPDGNTVYVGGNFSALGGVAVSRIAAIDPVACTVRPFRVAGVSSTVFALAATNSTVYLGGNFTTVASQPRQRFAAVNAVSGALLPWVANAELPGRAIAVSPDGAKVALAGDFMTVNGASSQSLAVVNGTTGANLRNYPGFTGMTSVVKSLKSDGTTFYGGAEAMGGGRYDGTFAVDWASMNEKWRTTCQGATQDVLPYRGTLYHANHHHQCENMDAFQDGKRIYFTAMRADDPSRWLGWFPEGNDGIGEGIGGRALVVGTGRTTGADYLWAGGEFTRINGQAQQGLTRFGPADTGAPPTPAVTARALVGGAIQVSFLSVVDPDDSNLTYRIYRNGSTTPIWTGTASSMWWVRPQVTFVDTGVTTGTTYGYRVTASDGTNTSGLSTSVSAQAVSRPIDYAGQVITDRPALYWRYDESTGTWAGDSSGVTTTTGLNGIYQRGITRTAGSVSPAGSGGMAAQLDGVEDFIWNDQLRPAPTAYSAETWFRTSSVTGGPILGYGDGRPRTNDGEYRRQSTDYDRWIYMENTGELRFGTTTGGVQSIRSVAAYNDNRWHHVVATQGPAGMTLHVDGVLIGSNPTVATSTYMGTWRVGAERLRAWPGEPASRYFAGQVDETAVYSYPLTQAQILRHWNLAGGSVPVGDTQAPTSPQSVAATTASGAVALTWASSTDNTGVTRYDIHRSATAGFTPSAATKIGEATTPGYRDTQAAPGTWYYRVVAVDAAGNTSGPSAAATATVTGAPTGTVVVTVPVSEDSMAAAVNATFAYGSLNQLSSRSTVGNSPIESFLRFAIPAAPAGTTLTGAVLQVRTSNDATASSPGAHSLRLVTAGAWSEPTITWNNRPTGLGATLGTLASAPALNSYYTMTLDASAMAPLAGTSPSFALIGESADNLRIWSKEAPNAAHRPTLTLTYAQAAAGRAFAEPTPSAPAPEPPAPLSDTQAPAAPSDLAGTTAGATVSLRWSPATDNVQVTGYRVYRGANADFAADASTLVSEVTAPEFADSGLAAGTYHYRVAAVDAAGNTSPMTAVVTATVEGATLPADPLPSPNTDSPESIVIQVPVAEDAMAAANAGFAYGSLDQLSARGPVGGSPIESFLRFAIPEAPGGTVLTGAALQIRTSTDATAGSTEAHAVRLLPDVTWSESALTWTTRPTGPGLELGRLLAATSVNTPYSAVLPPSAFASRTGTSVTLAVISDGGDNLRFFSKESQNVASRPMLTLTFSAK